MWTDIHFYYDSHSSQNKKCYGHDAEKIKIHIFGLITFFSENRTVYEITWKKYRRTLQDTDGYMAHARCVLDACGYKHTLRIYRVIQNDCRGFKNLSYTLHLR